MDIAVLEEVVQNVDDRLRRIEQILPSLATKEDLKAYATKDDLKAFATKEDLKAAIAPLATKEELKAYATKEDLNVAIAPLATKAEMREEGELTRQHFNAVAERLETSIQVIAEGQVALQERFDEFRQDIKGELAQHDRRITRLEASSPQRSTRTKPK